MEIDPRAGGLPGTSGEARPRIGHVRGYLPVSFAYLATAGAPPTIHYRVDHNADRHLSRAKSELYSPRMPKAGH
jgi:hypothetical protein